MKKLLIIFFSVTVLGASHIIDAFDQAPDPIENAIETPENYKTFTDGLQKYLAGYDHDSSVAITDKIKQAALSYDTHSLLEQIKSYIEKAKENPFLKNLIEKIETIFHKIVGDPQAFLNDPQGFISTHYNDSL